MADILLRLRDLPCRPSISNAHHPRVRTSGLGGLSVFREVARARPDASFIYAADDAAFPYGALSDAALVARVSSVMDT